MLGDKGQQQYVLPQQQRIELNKAVYDFVVGCGAGKSLTTELSVLLRMNVSECDALAQGRDPDLLLKKWNSILRLHRKIFDLEQKCQRLTKELESGADSEVLNMREERSEGVIEWIPRSTASFQIDLGGSVTGMKLHPSLPIIFVVTDQGKLVAYDLFNTSMPVHSTQAHIKCVTSLGLVETSEGTLMLSTTSKDLLCKLWEFSIERGFQTTRTLSSHEHIVSQSQFFSSGSDLLLLTCSRDLTVKVWDTKSGWCIRSFQPHVEWVRTLDVCGDYIITGSNDCSIRLSHWRSGNGLSMGTIHEFPVERVILIPMKNPSGTKDGGKEKDQDEQLVFTKYDPDYYPLGFKYCISCSRDNLIILWKVPLPKFIPHRPPQPNPLQKEFEKINIFKGHTSWVRDIEIRGRHLFSCSDDRSVRCWDLVTGQCLKVWPEISQGFVNCLAIDSDISSDKLLRKIFLVGSVNGKCNVFMK